MPDIFMHDGINEFGVYPSVDRLEYEPYHYLFRTPRPRSGHRILTDDDYLYIIGGYSTTGPHSMPIIHRDFHAFNLLTEEWRRFKMIGEVPVNLTSFSIVQMQFNKRQFLLFGGSGITFGETSSNKTYLMTIYPEKFEVTCDCIRTKGQTKPHCYGQAMTTGEDPFTFYVVGGTDGHMFNLDVHRLRCDPKDESWTWTKLNTEFKEGIYKLEVVYYENKLIFIGGGNALQIADLVKPRTFNLETNKFERIETRKDRNLKKYPLPRRCHSLSRHGDEIYMVGGSFNVRTGILQNGVETMETKIMGDAWSLNLKTLRWRFLKQLPLPVFFHDSAMTADGCLLIHGGTTDKESQERTSVIQYLWVKPPPLKYLAAKDFYCMMNPNLTTRNGTDSAAAEFKLSETHKLVLTALDVEKVALEPFWEVDESLFVIMKFDTMLPYTTIIHEGGGDTEKRSTTRTVAAHTLAARQNINHIAIDEEFCAGRPRSVPKLNEVVRNQLASQSILRAIQPSIHSDEGQRVPLLYCAVDYEPWENVRPLGTEPEFREYQNAVIDRVIRRKISDSDRLHRQV